MIHYRWCNNDTLTGNGGDDTFNVDSGTDTVTDLSTGDDLVVSSGATANATDITAFVADSVQQMQEQLLLQLSVLEEQLI